MIRYFKPARDKQCQRGFFSYMKESIINLYNAETNNPNQEIKIFYDLRDIPGYGEDNIYDICFSQDYDDYTQNKNLYSNIENETWNVSSYDYDYNLFNEQIRKSCEEIIKKYLCFTDDMKRKISDRHDQIDFNTTVGFHRRATDMERSHGFKALTLQEIFTKIEIEEFNNIFLMSDNLEDLQKFKQRYGNKLITYDDLTSSKDIVNPFFKQRIKDKELIITHIQEIIFGSLTLGKTKKLICTLSNLTGFSILSNSQLNYEILNNK